jgi:hypothetical protein
VDKGDGSGQQQAEALLGQIPATRSRLRQRLLLAAAITRLLRKSPIVVGGTAEEYWAGGEYHPTDLDLCPEPTASDYKALIALGLQKRGRHWVRDDLPVAVEFPGSGDDIERTVLVKVSGVSIRMISCEDLYLDRVRQATVSWPREDVSFDSAWELALTNYKTIDWDYIRARLKAATITEQEIGTYMVAVNRRVRPRARRAQPRPTATQTRDSTGARQASRKPPRLRVK